MNRRKYISLSVSFIILGSFLLALYTISNNLLEESTLKTLGETYETKAYDREKYPELNFSSCGNPLLDTTMQTSIITEFYSEALQKKTVLILLFILLQENQFLVLIGLLNTLVLQQLLRMTWS